MSDYIPTTEVMRHDYAGGNQLLEAEFDRWLAQIGAPAKADAQVESLTAENGRLESELANLTAKREYELSALRRINEENQRLLGIIADVQADAEDARGTQAEFPSTYNNGMKGQAEDTLAILAQAETGTDHE